MTLFKIKQIFYILTRNHQIYLSVANKNSNRLNVKIKNLTLENVKMIWYQVIVIFVLISIKFSDGFSDLVINNKKVNLTMFDKLKKENLTELNSQMQKKLRKSNLVTKDQFHPNDKSLSDYNVEYIHIIPKPQNVNSYTNNGYYTSKYNIANNNNKNQQYIQVTTTIPYKNYNNLPIDDDVAEENLITFMNLSQGGPPTTEKWENAIENPPYTSIGVTQPSAYVHASPNNFYGNSFNGNGIRQPNIKYVYDTTDYPVVESSRPLKQFFTSTPAPFVSSSTIANTIANILGFNRPDLNQPVTNFQRPINGQNPLIYLNYNSEVNKNKGKK